MLDVKMIRQKPDEFKDRLSTRGVAAEEIDALLDEDQKRRDLLNQTEQLKSQRNKVSGEIAQAKRNKEDASDAIAKMREVGQKIKELEDRKSTRLNSSHL